MIVRFAPPLPRRYLPQTVLRRRGIPPFCRGQWECCRDTQLADLDVKQHDAVLDYYGRKLATCSSDRTIKIFEIEGETQRLIETLKG